MSKAVNLIGTAVVLATMLPISANAAEWQFIGSSEDSTVHVYIDTTSLNFDSSGNVTYWSKTALTPYQPQQGKLVKEDVTLYEAECRSRRIRRLQLTTYFSDGTTMQQPMSGAWSYVTPDTLKEGMFQYACARKP